MIELKDAGVSFTSGFTLQPVSLRLAAEQTHVFLGSSGSGKTTLLKAILGLQPLDQGAIHVFSHQVHAATQIAIARLVGYVPQDGGLFPHMTNAQNASIGGRVAKLPPARQRQRLTELCALVGLQEADLERFPSEISGGQRQRVALMRALFNDPPLIVLDEPLGALDPMIRTKLQADLKAIFTRLKKMVVIVTHDLGEAAYFGHTISLFHEGRMLQHSTLQGLVQKPSDPFVTEFLNAYRSFDFSRWLEPAP